MSTDDQMKSQILLRIEVHALMCPTQENIENHFTFLYEIRKVLFTVTVPCNSTFTEAVLLMTVISFLH